MQIHLALPILGLIAASLSLWPATASPQETEPGPVHWAYSAYFGTGWYSVSGDRDVFVARMTPRWTRSEARLDADGSRAVGINFKFPISVGLNDFEFDDPLDAVDVDNVSYLSVNPGIDIEIPINRVWSLRPYASIGYGQAFGTSESAWTYWAGVKSRLAFRSGKLNWRLLNQIAYVGYTPNTGPSDSFTPLMIGFEFDYPLAFSDNPGKRWLLHWYTTYSVYGDNLEFTAGSQQITDQWELGAALGGRDSPIQIWFMKFDRLGLGYRTSSNGDLRGITFVFRSEFDE